LWEWLPAAISSRQDAVPTIKNFNFIGRANLFRKEVYFICGRGFPATIIERRFFAAGKPLPQETKKLNILGRR
jgi:hypothetical protein